MKLEQTKTCYLRRKKTRKRFFGGFCFTGRTGENTHARVFCPQIVRELSFRLSTYDEAKSTWGSRPVDHDIRQKSLRNENKGQNLFFRFKSGNFLNIWFKLLLTSYHVSRKSGDARKTYPLLKVKVEGAELIEHKDEEALTL